MSSCEEFLSDPQRFGNHVESCESCRIRLEELEEIDARMAAAAIPVETTATPLLPLAPWEHARHESWGLSIGLVAGIALVVLMLFQATNVSPVSGFANVIRSEMVAGPDFLRVVAPVGRALRAAPLALHLGLGAAFFVVNLLLVLLLRKGLRGYDASR